MTRAEIEAAYTVTNGIIRSPGKFEGERVYMPAMYAAYLDGSADDDGEILSVEVTDADRAEFPELGSLAFVRFEVVEEGFVVEIRRASAPRKAAPPVAPIKPSKDAQTPVSTHDDGKFIRTAIVLGKDASGSLAIVDPLTGKRLALVNVFRGEASLIVDVIDVDGVFTTHRALGFVKSTGARNQAETDTIVSADFRIGDA